MNLERASERAYSVPRVERVPPGSTTTSSTSWRSANPGPRLETAGEQALAQLENRFPGVREAARQIEEPPSLSRRAGDALHGVHRGTQQPPPIARQGERSEVAPPRWSRSRLHAYMRAHPACAVGMAAFLIIVVVKLWVYMVLGAIALTAVKTYTQR